MQRFKDKVVIVTGAGSGIGRAIAIAFGREGAKVVVGEIDANSGQEAAKIIQDAGGTASFTAVDVSKVDSVNALVGSAVKAHGQLNVYISNAGITGGHEPCAQGTDEVWNRVIGVNLSGCFYGARAALPHLIKTRGNIVMTASVAAFRGGAADSSYTASKHGVLGLVNQIACEYGPQGVRVNGVAPGAIHTNIDPVKMSDPEVQKMICAITPLARWGTPEEIANGVLFLASEEASYITGTLLRIDGGWGSR